MEEKTKMKKEKRFTVGNIVFLIILIILFIWCAKLIAKASNNTENMREIKVTVYRKDIETMTFGEEFVHGSELKISLNVNGDEHDLTLTTLSDNKVHRVEVIPTDNGEFLGINFPEGKLLFGNYGDAKLSINTQYIEEYPYNIELNYFEDIVKICIE